MFELLEMPGLLFSLGNRLPALRTVSVKTAPAYRQIHHQLAAGSQLNQTPYLA